jgi:hypothetical protein
MKKAILLVLFVVFCLPFVIGQNSPKKASHVGNWKFEAPYAPEGYTSGAISIGQADQKYTADMSFAGSEYKFTGEKVKAVKDSLSFMIYLEGQDIRVILKLENEMKMSGKAIYSEGEVPLTLTKSEGAAKK